MSNEDLAGKSGNITDRRIEKSIDSISKTIDTRNRSRAIIIADSKGRELQKQRAYNTHINIQYRSGAKIRNACLDSAVKRHLNDRTIRYPIALFWHGTCELTIKTKDGFKMPDNMNTHINALINTYRTYAEELLTINPRTTIIFLPCPYFDLNVFNLSRGKKLAQIDQNQLEQAVDRYNTEISSINGISTPKIWEDLLKYSKGKKQKVLKK